MADILLTSAQAAERFAVHPNTLRKLAAGGAIAKVRPAARPRRRDRAYLAHRRTGQAAAAGIRRLQARRTHSCSAVIGADLPARLRQLAAWATNWRGRPDPGIWKGPVRQPAADADTPGAAGRASGRVA